MKKKIFYTALLLLGIMGALPIGVDATYQREHYPDSSVSYTLNEINFTAGTITITGADGTTITILDRNLGATAAGTGACEDSSWAGTCYGGGKDDPTYGYHFQWGNNHGFKPCTDSYICKTFPNNENTGTQLSSITYNPFYTDAIFRIGDYNWISDDSIVDLWGGSVDDNTYDLDGTGWQVNNPTSRQGPCPKNFHVPSKGELDKLQTILDGDGATVRNELLIPLAGSRAYNEASVESLGSYAALWSSSPDLAPYLNSRTLVLDVEDEMFLDNYSGRAQAYSIRCFYDKYKAYEISSNLNLIFISENVEVGSGTATYDMTGVVPVAVTTAMSSLVNTGYTFSGSWSLSGEITAFDFENTPISGDWADASGNVYFFAQWTPITYSVEFTGTDVLGTMANQDFTYDVAQNLTDNAFTRTGYTFSGWTDGTTGYTNSQNVSNLTTTNGATVTLTAQWTANTYSVKFEAGEGTGTMANQDFTYDVAQNLTANAFTRTGYTFSGWTDGATGYTDSQNVINLTTTNNDIITFTAQWTPITYTIAFSGNSDDVIGTQASINAEYDSGDIAPESSFTRTGYTFSGWNTQAGGSGTGYATGDTLINLSTTGGDIVTLYAQWTANIHKLSFVVDGTTIQSGDIAYATTISAPADPTKDSCNSFAGWTSSVEGLTSTGTMPDSDVIFTANWDYTCSRSSGGGGGGGTKTTTTTTTGTVTTGSVATGTVTTGTNETNVKSDNKTNSEDKDNQNNGDKGENQKYSDEMQRAYESAYKHGITTMDSIEKADMEGPLTRIAMAKMLSYYAINVLGLKPDETRVNKFNDVSDKMNAEYNNAVTLAYQLGIMGINMPKNKFRPNDLVTRAEFATALSRMLYKIADGKDKYYSTHLAKLMEEKIITNDNPNLQELRGYVMIMLMRSAQS